MSLEFSTSVRKARNLRGWSLRKVAEALDISPGALPQYIKASYAAAGDYSDSSLFPLDTKRQLDSFREALEQLRRAVPQVHDPHAMGVVLLGQKVYVLREEDLPKRLALEVLGYPGKVVVLAFGRRRRAVMAALREMKPRGPEKA